ncbi:MAG TPA: flagellar motor switch protein FliN [Candidatus Aquilonibacter sp.]|nr:flagellar motor switch protein FliN [Candidatus Aquilonibacter sp.]
MKSFAELSIAPRPQTFLNVWNDSFADVLQKTSSRKFESRLADAEGLQAEARTAAEKGLCVIFSGGGALRGQLAFQVSETDAKLLAEILMGQAPEPDAQLSDVDRDAACEVFRQVAGQVAIDLGAKWSATVSLSFEAASPLTWEPAAMATVCITGADGRKLVALLSLQENLLASLMQDPTVSAASPSGAAASKQGGKSDAASSAPEAPGTNLDLLLDIELEATIRFGQREMQLRDVLDLRSGSVIELERHVEEPAELLVAGRPVARGEVVVVEGNYGLRITEILSPRQRYEVVGR